MGQLRRMYDASLPSEITDVPQWEVVALYIGGNTPHRATDKEWNDQVEKSGAQWKLPIYTRSNPQNHDPIMDAKEAIAWLKAHNVDRGAACALDLETAVNPHYVHVFDATIRVGGYKTLAYGSADFIRQNPMPSAGYWIAHYTGKPHLCAGAMATQWSGSGPFQGQYDPSIVSDALILWRVPLTLSTTDKIWIDKRMELWATRVVQAIGGRSNEAFNDKNPDMEAVLSLKDIEDEIKAPPVPVQP